MSNAFFTNASQINLALVKKLQAIGYKSIVLADTEEAKKAALAAGASVAAGNLDHPESFSEILKTATFVFHTPNIYDLEPGAFDGAAVDNLLKQLEGTKKTFIYTSHTWVLGDVNDVLADEKTPLSPVSLVAPLAQYEEKVKQAAKNGIRTIVVRPATVYGYEGDFVQEYVKRTIREKAAHFAGNGENHLSFVAVEDLLDLYIAVIAKGVAGNVYHASNGQALTSKEFATTVGKAVNVTKVTGLSETELKASYGALAEAFALDQQIASVSSKEQLQWTPKHTDLKQYIEQTEKALAAGVR